MRGGVVACLFSFSVCLFLFVHTSLYFSPFLSLIRFVFCALSGGSIGSEPRSQCSKSGFKCSHTRVCPTGTIPTSHLAVKVEEIVCMCICVRCVLLCVPAAAVSHQFITRFSCCNLLMDHLWGVMCIMQNLGCADTFKNRQLQSSVCFTSAPSFLSVCWAGGGKEAEWRTDFWATGGDGQAKYAAGGWEARAAKKGQWPSYWPKAHAHTNTHTHMNTHISPWLFSSVNSEGFSATYKCLCVPLALVHPFLWLISRQKARKGWECCGPPSLDPLTTSFWDTETISCPKRSCSYATYATFKM